MHNTPANILIVDDSEDERALCSHVLSNDAGTNYTILEANNIASAMSIIENNDIHCVLLDYQLPDEDGFSLLNKLHNNDSTHPSVIMFTGNGDETLAVKAMKLGADDYLVKDYDGQYQKLLPSVVKRSIEHAQSYQERKALRNQQTSILNAIASPIIGVDNNQNIIFINLPAREFFLMKPGKENKITEFFSSLESTHQKTLLNAYEQLIQNVSDFQCKETISISKDMSQEIFFEVSLYPISGNTTQLTGALFVFHNVTDNKKLTFELEYQATHDTLTNLPNRSLLKDRLEQAILSCKRKNKKIALLFLDLDEFKLVNDSLGHQVGDHLLVEVAKRISKITRDTDTLARLGGDEFILLLNDIESPEDSGYVAKTIIKSLSEPFILNSDKHHIGVSIGISTFPEDSQDLEMLIQFSDEAMYEAKIKGRNTYQFYHSELHARANENLEISYKMKEALTEHQFTLVFQPQIDALAKRLYGMETLIRWHSENLGTIPPSKFIPIAERNSFIQPLGKWILNHAFECYESWKEVTQPDFKLSINLSIKQFGTPSFLNWIADAIEQHRIDPKIFGLEITENVFAEDFSEMLACISELKNLGFSIILDDFGTGYSCLMYLDKLPIDMIKIDPAFISQLALNHNNQNIVKAIMHLANDLDIRLLAEGVETIEQRDILLDLGCTLHQGFLYGKPIAEASMIDYLRVNTDLKHKGMS